MMPFDLRDALRGLRRDLGYTATTVLTLALTIGATTATFSIVNGVLLRPLAYRESHQLVALREVFVEIADRYPVLPLNGRHFEEWRSGAQTFDAFAEYLPLSANLTGTGDAVQIALVKTSGGLFDVLRVSPILGRGLRTDDERREAPDVAVIGDALWRERFSGDPAIVGRSITLDGKPHTVVGVLPAGFQLPKAPFPTATFELTSKVDALAPLRLATDLGWVGDFNNVGIGRLKRGVSLAQARADLDVIQGRIAKRVSEEAGQPATMRALIVPLTEAVVGGARRGLVLLMGAIVAVLLIACANLANLSLTRATARLRDAMIKAALGASRVRLIGQLLLEQLLIAGAGGVLGTLVARGALQTFVRTAPIDLPRVAEVTIDARALAFAAAVSIAAALLTALLPAWRLGRERPGSLRATGTAITADRHSLRTRGVLLAAQMALSVALLVVTGLFAVSFLKLMRVDRGFSADRVLAVDVALPSSRYESNASRVAAYDRLMAAVQPLPGIESAAWASALPLKGEDWGDLVTAEGDVRPPFERPIASYRAVGPDYFRTLTIPLRRGRAFTDADRADTQPSTPAVISEATAAHVWPGQQALGKRFRRGGPGKPLEVVGITPDVRTMSIDGPLPLMVYVPYWYRSRPAASLVARTAADPASMAGAIRRAIQSVDADVAIGDSRPLQQIVDAAFAARRYQTTLFVAFGASALLIAVVGVYAVTAYGISRRRREMNIRVALGARASQVLGLVVRQTGMPVVAGAVAGGAAAVALGGVVASQLFEVRARDPLVIAATVAFVTGVAMFTSAIAARQGLSIDPAAALRDE
jgi:putative ABC transport system permease protein